MKLPSEVAVMTLPNATLFPQAFLPLYIFEPRYRKMLADSLNGHRMFSIAMQKPGSTRESPSPVAGIGLVRVAVEHPDGTSHLILQGVARVQLIETVRYKPYRVQRIRPLESPPCNTLAVDALLAKVRELLRDWVKLGLPFPFPSAPKSGPGVPAADVSPADVSPADVLDYLDKIEDPEQVADLVSCAVLTAPHERQAILEAVHLESRFRQLVQFLMVEIRRNKNVKR